MAEQADPAAGMTSTQPDTAAARVPDLGRRVGFWTAVSTAVVGLAALGLAVTTLPRSGPYCQSNCVRYPYTDAVAYVPRDYLWMYPALLLTVLFVMLAACVHEEAPRRVRLLSRMGVAFAVIAATAIVVDYAVQLTVMQPSLLKGETAGLAALSQYNPHGVFIALENVGYLAMAVAFVFLGTVFPGPSGLMRGLRWVFVVGGVVTVLLLLVFAVWYRSDLDYRFEVFAILVDWLVLIVAGVLLGRYFRRSGTLGGRVGPAAG